MSLARYRSRTPIEERLRELRVLAAGLDRFRGKIFVHLGVDQATGTQPARMAVATFITSARSVIQYAHKEAQAGGCRAVYESAVRTRPLLGLFGAARNAEIHERGISLAVEASGIAHILPPGDVARSDGGWSDEAAARMHITYVGSVCEEITEQVLVKLRANCQHAEADAAERGEPLHWVLEHDGERDVFALCDAYLAELESFVKQGVREGFIS